MREVTRERLEEIVRDPMINQGSEFAMMARMALAAMDSEPVAWVSQSNLDALSRGHDALVKSTDNVVQPVPLYRHARPAPEMTAIVERLNDSGYEYEDGEVTPQNAATVVDILLQQLNDAVQGQDAQPAPVVPEEMLCDFYEVNNWTDLVRELVKHVEQLQDSARRNVKPWEDTFPETLLPAYIERIKHADEACRAAMLNQK